MKRKELVTIIVIIIACVIFGILFLKYYPTTPTIRDKVYTFNYTSTETLISTNTLTSTFAKTEMDKIEKTGTATPIFYDFQGSSPPSKLPQQRIFIGDLKKGDIIEVRQVVGDCTYCGLKYIEIQRLTIREYEPVIEITDPPLIYEFEIEEEGRYYLWVKPGPWIELIPKVYYATGVGIQIIVYDKSQTVITVITTIESVETSLREVIIYTTSTTSK